MALNVFPELPGLAWSVFKTDTWQTRLQRAVSGRAVTSIDHPVPIWKWVLTYSLLRDANDTRAGANVGFGIGFDELRTLQGFHLQQRGSGIPFLFSDNSDHRVTNQFLGTADGTNTIFQMVRLYGNSVPGGGFAEPITNINLNNPTINGFNIYVDGVYTPTGYTLDPDNGTITWATPPTAGRLITADFSYYFKVRFSQDTAEAENFMYQLWQMKTVKLESAL